MNSVKVFLLLFYICINHYGSAQVNRTKEWKKIVRKEVEFSGKWYYMRDLSDSLMKLALSGKIATYWPNKHALKIMNSQDIIDKIYPLVEDPKNKNAGVRDSFYHGPGKTNFEKYVIVEEWTFDRLKGTTEVEIFGIEPIVEVYTSEWVSKGPVPMFYFKYKDLVKLTSVALL